MIDARPGQDLVIEQLQKLLARLAARREVSHVAVGASPLDGSWTYTDATGVADPAATPMRTDTPWLIASVTKLHIAATILRLQERGQLDLTALLTRSLPEEFTHRLHVHRGTDHTAELTAIHLLGHLSGLPDYLDEKPAHGSSLMDEVLAGPDRGWTPDDAVRRARDQLSTHFPPSDPHGHRPRIRYSDTNYQLLVVAAEHVTGQPIHELFHELLFDPLDLSHTWLPGRTPTESTPTPAVPWVEDRPLDDRPKALASFGDLYCTTEDLLRFGRALFTGTIFDDPATVATMGQRFRRFGIPTSMASLRAPGWPIQYSLGLMRFQPGRLLAGGRSLPTVVGHTGATGSWLWHVPELDLVVAGTADQTRAVAEPFRTVPRALASLRR